MINGMKIYTSKQLVAALKEAGFTEDVYKRQIYLLAFLFPVLVFTLGFALKGVYPFGENSALVVDCLLYTRCV